MLPTNACPFWAVSSAEGPSPSITLPLKGAVPLSHCTPCPLESVQLIERAYRTLDKSLACDT